jgi:hypothetical protein
MFAMCEPQKKSQDVERCGYRSHRSDGNVMVERRKKQSEGDITVIPA